MAHYFDKKEISDFNSQLKHVFNFLTISGKYKLIGSAGLKSIKYNSDYDLMELVNKTDDPNVMLIHIGHLFLKKFREARADPNMFITDFKCGVDGIGEPLRWSEKDLERGFKMDGKNKITFTSALILKSTCKLDAIVLIKGIFTEFSDNYLLKLGQYSNFNKDEVSKEGIESGLLDSFKEYSREKNYWKVLKRIFSYKLLKNKRKWIKELVELIDWFNSPVGQLNKIRSDLDIILLVGDCEFRKPKISDIVYNLKVICSSLLSTQMDFTDIIFDINKIMELKNLHQILSGINGIRNELEKNLNWMQKSN